MKKILAFVFVLFLAVISAACVNKYAIQELNGIAMKYIQEGNPQAAISRLEASVDLDPNIYDSRYNLAICFIQTGEYEKAIEQLNAAKAINPDAADIYYNLGVAYENISIKIADDNSEDDNDTSQNNSQFNKEDYLNNLKIAVENYEIYLQKSNDISQNKIIEEKISDLNNRIIEQTDGSNE